MKNFKVTLDRIEKGVAVLLLRKDESVRINLPLFLLPEGVCEGEILDIVITRDIQETESAKRGVSTLLEQLQNKNKNQD